MDGQYEPETKGKYDTQQHQEDSKGRRKKKGVRAFLIVVCCVVVLAGVGYAAVTVYTRHLFSQAESLIERKKYSEAEVILAKLSNSEHKTELLDQIAYEEALEEENALFSQAESLIERRRYSEADVILAKLPNSERKTECLAKISYEEALEAANAHDYELADQLLRPFLSENLSGDTKAKYDDLYLTILLQTGKYVEADELLSAMPETEEIKTLREELFYESRILRCVQIVRDTLLYPESMVVYDVVLLEESKLDEEASTDEQNVYVEQEPTCIIYSGAQNKGGGITDSYCRLVWNDGDYEAKRDVDSLEVKDADPPSYYDLNEKLEYWNDELEKLNILQAMHAKTWIYSFDLDRINGLLKNGFPDQVELLPHNSVVPEPTPRIEPLNTPEPTETSGA